VICILSLLDSLNLAAFICACSTDRAFIRINNGIVMGVDNLTCIYTIIIDCSENPAAAAAAIAYIRLTCSDIAG
jgi:hypothetical protein